MNDNNAFVENPKMTVVLVTRGNKLGYLKNCLQSLKAQKFRDFEVVIVTKNIPGEIEALVKSQNIRFVEEKGKTLGAARNLGIQNSKAELISFIDDDAEAPPEWLENIDSAFSRFPNLSCLGGPHITPKNESNDNPIRLVEGLFGEAYLQSANIDKSAIGKIAGCNATYKRSVFQDIGYLNEALRTCEDWEFNRRLLEKGYSLRFDPDVWVFHHRQGIKHIFEGSSKSAPFYLSWKTLKLSRYDSLIASFYGSNFVFLFLVFLLFISPLAFAIIFPILVIGYISFAAIRTHTYNRKIVYFPLIIFLTLTRIIGFYFGIIKTAAFKLSARFKR